ncbi:MAG TPA: molybdopterin-dependent oxidoreductase [Rhizobiaceae bacterium]|nr:molybdopterin-dependent oxidoreductase [Rhizobiaceae bacterium]
MKPIGIRRISEWSPLLMLVAVSAFLSSQSAVARELARPTGTVLLTVTGNVDKTNQDGAALFDREMLAAFPLHRIVTTTPWTDGIKQFEGILLRDLLREVGAKGHSLHASALNDYRIEIPVSDAEQFGVLIAIRMDGQPLHRRDKGPLWIVYPRDSIPTLQDERYDSRWVWQLHKIEVR